MIYLEIDLLLIEFRDLADNWNIDIARELEDYLGELEKITFSFDGVSKSLNFAEGIQKYVF